MHPNSKEGASHYIYYIHFYLSSIIHFSNNIHSSEESMIEDFRFNDLVKSKWKINPLRGKTVECLREFRIRWLEYKKKNSFGDDFVFNYLDGNWKEIVNTYLIPALDCLESDMVSFNIDFIPYKKHYNPNTRPSDELILERVRLLYDLLLKHKVIGRRYMD